MSFRRIRLHVTLERQEHVEKNHTYRNTWWDYDNLMRQGAEGDITFYGLNVNVATKLTNLVAAGGTQALARTTGGFLQGPVGTDTVGVDSVGGGGALVPGGIPPGLREYVAAVTQCYPTNGTPIRGKTLVGIGRLLGLMP